MNEAHLQNLLAAEKRQTSLLPYWVQFAGRVMLTSVLLIVGVLGFCQVSYAMGALIFVPLATFFYQLFNGRAYEKYGQGNFRILLYSAIGMTIVISFMFYLGRFIYLLVY